MKNRQYFFFIIILFLILLLTLFVSKSNIWFFSLICVGLLIGFISYNLGLRNGIILGMFSSFMYGSFLLYFIFMGYIILNSFLYYLWIILLPICAVIFGIYGDSIRKMTEDSKNFESYILNNTYIDPITGLPTRGAFYKNLFTESSFIKKHAYPLTIMLIKLEYNEELMAIFKTEEYGNIIKAIIKKIESIVGPQNRKFLLGSGKMAIFLNYMEIEEAELLKAKLYNELENIEISDVQKDEFNFKFRIVVKKFDKDMEPIKFESYIEKDLEYEN